MKFLWIEWWYSVDNKQWEEPLWTRSLGCWQCRWWNRRDPVLSVWWTTGRWHLFPNGTWQTCPEQRAPAFFTGNLQFAQFATNLRHLHASLWCFWIDDRGIFFFFKCVSGSQTTTAAACCLSRDTSELIRHSHLLEGRQGEKEQSSEVILDTVYPAVSQAVSCGSFSVLEITRGFFFLSQNS